MKLHLLVAAVAAAVAASTTTTAAEPKEAADAYVTATGPETDADDDQVAASDAESRSDKDATAAPKLTADGAGAGGGGDGGFAPAEQALWVDRHNYFRMTALPFAAAGMLQVKWSAELATQAAGDTKGCAAAPAGARGINAALVDSKASNVVDGAMDQWVVGPGLKAMTGLKAPKAGEGVGAGIYNSYSQVVWSATNQFGCARAACDGGKVAVVCKYAPAGNDGSAPWYVHGPPGSGCPEGTVAKVGLCQVPGDEQAYKELAAIPAGQRAYDVYKDFIPNMQKALKGELKPDDSGKKPSDDNKKPSDDTKKPDGDNKKPGDDTKKPDDDTKKPSDGTKKPSDDTKKPSDETKKPTEDDGKKSGDGSKPADGNAGKTTPEPPKSVTPGKKVVLVKKHKNGTIIETISSGSGSAGIPPQPSAAPGKKMVLIKKKKGSSGSGSSATAGGGDSSVPSSSPDTPGSESTTLPPNAPPKPSQPASEGKTWKLVQKPKGEGSGPKPIESGFVNDVKNQNSNNNNAAAASTPAGGTAANAKSGMTNSNGGLSAAGVAGAVVMGCVVVAAIAVFVSYRKNQQRQRDIMQNGGIHVL